MQPLEAVPGRQPKLPAPKDGADSAACIKSPIADELPLRKRRRTTIRAIEEGSSLSSLPAGQLSSAPPSDLESCRRRSIVNAASHVHHCGFRCSCSPRRASLSLSYVCCDPSSAANGLASLLWAPFRGVWAGVVLGNALPHGGHHPRSLALCHRQGRDAGGGVAGVAREASPFEVVDGEVEEGFGGAFVLHRHAAELLLRPIGCRQGGAVHAFLDEG